MAAKAAWCGSYGSLYARPGAGEAWEGQATAGQGNASMLCCDKEVGDVVWLCVQLKRRQVVGRESRVPGGGPLRVLFERGLVRGSTWLRLYDTNTPRRPPRPAPLPACPPCLARLACRSGFGELALLYSAPRAASVRATTDCRLWVMERQVRMHLIMGL